MNPFQAFRHVSEYLASRHGALFVTVLALLGVYPFAGRSWWTHLLLDLCWALVLVSLLRAVWHQHTTRRLVVLFGLPAIVAGALAGSARLSSLEPVALGLRVALLAVIIAGLFRNLLERRRITMDAVLSACCIYLLLGIGWAGVYGLIHRADPMAIGFPDGAGPSRDDLELLYFSLITLTTVGYGDITPVSAAARMAAAIEGLVAQLYLAIVIARLVSIELAQRKKDPLDVSDADP